MITSKIELELRRYIDKDYECNHSVLTFKVNNNMRQITGLEAEALYEMIKDILEKDLSDIKFEEDKENGEK